MAETQESAPSNTESTTQNPQTEETGASSSSEQAQTQESSSSSSQEPPKQSNCTSCKKPKASEELKPCSKCHSQTTAYCSRDCQKSDWKVHKKICAKEAQAYAANADIKMASRSAPKKDGHRGGLQKWQFDT